MKSPYALILALREGLRRALRNHFGRAPLRVAAVEMASVSTSTTIQALVDALPEPAIVLDRRNLVLNHNTAAAALLKELRRSEPLSFALRAPAVLEALRAAHGGTAIRVDYHDRVPVERWITAHAAPLGVGNAEVLLTLQDLTPMHRAERMRGDFIANASHELRTPLASLLGFVETLQGPAKEDAAARKRFLEIMRVQANRMARLVDDLLSLSRIEQKQHVRPQDRVDMGRVARQVADALAPLAEERRVTLSLTVPETPLFVRGDRDELIRVVENLLENAIKYSRDGGHAELVLILEGGEVRAQIRDDGPGIAPQHVPRLTERFYRVDAEESRDKGGTGLGLAIVKHILTRHEGRLLIESTVGKGSTFSAVLPHCPADE